MPLLLSLAHLCRRRPPKECPAADSYAHINVTPPKINSLKAWRGWHRGSHAAAEEAVLLRSAEEAMLTQICFCSLTGSLHADGCRPRCVLPLRNFHNSGT